MGDICVKCSYKAENKRFGLEFCNVCIKFCPDSPEEVDKYAEEEIDSMILATFRKNTQSRGHQQKNGMIKKAENGHAVSRAPFGYIFVEKKLTPTQNFREVEEIFEEFLEDKMSLNKLAEKHNFSVNGLKKVLTNFTYIGKIRFNNQVYDGNHKPIIDAILFNKVQDKMEKIVK